MRVLVINSLLLAGALLAPGAQAHYLWIDAEGGNRLRFGEYEEAVHERSPGRLDEIPGPRARSGNAGAGQAVALVRQGDGFGLPAPAGGGLLVQEDAVAVKDLSRAGIGIVKPVYYARYSTSAAAQPPRQRLDIVPAGETGAVAVYFDGKPLAGSAVKIVAPNGWLQEGKTGADGRVVLPMPWRGPYIVQVVHLEPAPGEFGGQRYEALRHVATLTLAVARGARTFRPVFAQP